MVQGLARGPLKAEIRVRIPVSLPKFLQNHSLKFSCREQLGPFWKTTYVLRVERCILDKKAEVASWRRKSVRNSCLLMVVGLARAANTEGVGDAVDVTEPGSDERDL